MTAAIERHGLTKRYGARAAVNKLDLTVEAGQVFGFLGPNGAGKTTTLRMPPWPGWASWSRDRRSIRMEPGNGMG